MPRIKKFIYILAVALSIIYLLWRIFFTIPWHAPFFILVYALLLFFSEVISNITGYILIFFRMMASNNKETLTTDKIDPTGEIYPVDLLIVTHNEEEEILRKTVNAATFIKYPDKTKLKIIIADDGNRPEIKKLAEEYGVTYIGMEHNTHAKSGNINHALEQLTAPLFAIFDTDMIPFSTFLEATVPLFVDNFKKMEADPDHTKPLGFVQTPQSFYNADIFQFNLFSEKIVPNEQDFFSRDINVLNSGNETALFTGSNTLFLRKAIDDAGGFPTNTLTEDFELGARINMAGYVSRSTETPQASGITPTDMKGVIKQRTRWARGVMQSCRNLHIFLNRKIPIKSRLILINSYFYWWSFARRLIYIIAPLLYSIFKIQVVNANFWVLMVIWAPGYFLLQYVMGDTGGKIRNARWGEIQETFFAPYLFIPVLLETLGIKATKFKVTQKNASESFKDKLYIIPYFILWALTLFAIIKFNYGKYGSEILVGSVITFWLLMHFINLSFCLFIANGRAVYRKSERFNRKITGFVKTGNQQFAIETQDVSEGGISFVLTADNDAEQNLPELKSGDKIAIELEHGEFPVKMTGKITRVRTDDDTNIYGVQIEVPDQKNMNHYLQLIYDGENRLLPTEQDTWITPFDELYMNWMMRLNQIERKFSKWTRE